MDSGRVFQPKCVTLLPLERESRYPVCPCKKEYIAVLEDSALNSFMCNECSILTIIYLKALYAMLKGQR